MFNGHNLGSLKEMLTKAEFDKYIVKQSDLYKRVYCHLIKTNQAFCFLENGELVSRETCKLYL